MTVNKRDDHKDLSRFVSDYCYLNSNLTGNICCYNELLNIGLFLRLGVIGKPILDGWIGHQFIGLFLYSHDIRWRVVARC